MKLSPSPNVLPSQSTYSWISTVSAFTFDSNTILIAFYRGSNVILNGANIG
jgi:hypothetical protein